MTMTMTMGTAAIAESPTRLRPVILVAEDEPLIASCIRKVLEDSGFAVCIASTGAEALSLAVMYPPDLALVDIRLAGPMNGIEVACRLREDLSVRAIFLSGLFDPGIVERAQAAQPIDFLQKPFRPSQVFNAIERALAVAGG